MWLPFSLIFRSVVNLWYSYPLLHSNMTCYILWEHEISSLKSYLCNLFWVIIKLGILRSFRFSLLFEDYGSNHNYIDCETLPA
jgi:hypothetical protein